MAEPPPPITAATAHSSSGPDAETASPPATSANATWLTRSAPWRRMKLPQPSWNTSEPTAANAT